MSLSSTLAARQQWLLKSIVQGPQASQMANQYILGSAQLSAAERLAIYQDGYRLRLLECMAAEFPTLQHYLGDPLFRLFCLGYLQHQPSRHYSLYQLGEGFADFLAATRPSEECVQSQWTARLKIPEQLARLERAQANALRAEGAPQYTVPEFSCLFQLPVLVLPQSSTLVEHDFALYDYVLAADRHAFELEQNQNAKKPETPADQPESLLIYRHHFQVKMATLEPWQTDIIRVLDQRTHTEKKNETIHEDWPTLLEHNRLSESELLMKLNLWLPQALKENQLTYLTMECKK